MARVAQDVPGAGAVVAGLVEVPRDRIRLGACGGVVDLHVQAQARADLAEGLDGETALDIAVEADGDRDGRLGAGGDGLGAGCALGDVPALEVVIVGDTSVVLMYGWRLPRSAAVQASPSVA